MKFFTKTSLIGLGTVGGTIATMAYLRRARFLDVNDRVVLITGGSRGLGLLMAHEFASRGARVAICARNEDELKGAAEQLQASGFTVATFVCDVTKRPSVEQLVSDVKAQLGPIEILVNNAGVLQMGPVETMTMDDYQDNIDTSFWAPLFTTLAVLPDMKARREGRIINISSIGGKLNAPHLAPYSAGKFALAGLSQGMRVELAKDGVLVTTVFPNAMRTGSFRNTDMKGQHRKEYALGSIANASPLISTGAARAARMIVEGAQRGDAICIPSLRAQSAIAFGSIFPGLTLEISSLIARFMPLADGPDSIGNRRAKGHDSESSLSPSILTAPLDKAARQNNEV